MRKFVFLIAIFLLLPLVSSAAYNDVQFPQDTNVYLSNPGITIIVKAGSNVASFTVYSDHLNIGFESGSQITLISYDRKTFSNSMSTNTVCHPSYSELTLSSASTQNTDIYISGDCSLGENNPPANYAGQKPVTTNGEVDVSALWGGKTSLVLTDGSEVILDILPYSVEDGTHFQISPVSKDSLDATALPEGEEIISAFDISASLGGTEVHHSSKSLSLTYIYPDSLISGIEEKTMKIYRIDGSTWTELSAIQSEAGNSLTSSIRDFSQFVVTGEKISAPAPSTPTPGTPGEGLSREQMIGQLQSQIREIMEQLIVLLTKAIAQLQAQLIELQQQQK